MYSEIYIVVDIERQREVFRIFPILGLSYLGKHLIRVFEYFHRKEFKQKIHHRIISQNSEHIWIQRLRGARG